MLLQIVDTDVPVLNVSLQALLQMVLLMMPLRMLLLLMLLLLMLLLLMLLQMLLQSFLDFNTDSSFRVRFSFYSSMIASCSLNAKSRE